MCIRDSSVRQVLFAHLFPVPQSALPTQSTQRPLPVSHTLPVGQSSEFTQGEYGTQELFKHSLSSGQSALVRQLTQRPLVVLQIVSVAEAEAQSRLFVQLMMARHWRSAQRRP